MARQSRLPPFLLTRPPGQADRFSAALRGRFGPDIRIVDAPLIAPRFLRPTSLEKSYKALIFTSETGVTAFARISADLGLPGSAEAWCVGDRTAEAAMALGLNAHSAKGDARALTSLIIASGTRGPLLHLRGKHTRGNIEDSLVSAGIETVSLVVYEQTPVLLTPEARDLLQSEGPVIVPLFSPRTTALFVAQTETLTLKARLFVAVLSDAVASGLYGLVPENLVVARRPDTDGMLSALSDLVASSQKA